MEWLINNNKLKQLFWSISTRKHKFIRNFSLKRDKKCFENISFELQSQFLSITSSPRKVWKDLIKLATMSLGSVFTCWISVEVYKSAVNGCKVGVTKLVSFID